MATWTVEFFPYNILESGTFTVNGDADVGYPETRLYDRAISLFYRDTASGDKAFAVDQSASPLPVDFLAIERHNSGGLTFAWQYADVDFATDPTDAVAPFVAPDGQVIKRISGPITHNLWRAYITAAVNPKIGEIYISKGFALNCLRDSNPFGNDVDQIQWNQSIGGVERGTKLGQKRRVRNYAFMLSATEFADFETVVDYLDDYSKPFYFKDHKDAYYLARFEEMPYIDFSHNTYARVSIKIVEML